MNPAKRPRPDSNCAECRRLKVKCDRQEVPCSGCIKRKCSELCPHDTLENGLKGLQALNNKVAELETALRVQASRSNPPDLSPLFQYSTDITSPAMTLRTADMSVPFSAGPQKATGTLVQSSNGENRFIGPSAGVQWHSGDLQRSDVPLSRAPSASRETSPHQPESNLYGFPLRTHSRSTYQSLRANLLSAQDIRITVDAYYRHIAWIGSPVYKTDLQCMLDRVLAHESVQPSEEILYLHELAVIFSVIALGCAANMELVPNDKSGSRFFGLAQQCLVSGKFMVINTMASLQALAVMGKYVAYSNIPRRWDFAWQIWGLATRILLAMGLHRDGQSWGLEQAELERRRTLFWEVYSTDIFNSINWNRPNGIAHDHFDAKYPTGWTQPQMTFSALRGDLAQLCKEVLDMSLRIGTPSFTTVTTVWQKFVAFEESIPYRFRCRASMIAMTLRYPTEEMAETDSPPAASTDMQLTFQQHHLTMNLSVAIANLLRPCFASSLRSHSHAPHTSEYGPAFLAVVERCHMLIAMVKSLHTLHPLPSIRHWFFWSHSFSAAATLATLCIISPRSIYSAPAFQGVCTMLELLPAIRESLPREYARNDIDWLLMLRDRASHAMSTRDLFSSGLLQSAQNPSADETPLETIGWRTKLIRKPTSLEADHTAGEEVTGGPVDDPWAYMGPITDDWIQRLLECPIGTSHIGLGPPHQSDQDALFDFNDLFEPGI